MPVLTVRQPYASMIMDGTKKSEYRNWKLPDSLTGMYILIHSAKGKPALFDNMDFETFMRYDEDALANGLYGAILGGAMFGEPTPYSGNVLFKWEWPIIDVIKLDDPIRNVPGKQGIWYCNFKELLQKK